MKPLLIILTGHAPEAIRNRHGDFDAWFRRTLNLPSAAVRVIDVAASERLPAPADCAGAVISGSAAMVTDREPWSEATAGWIRDAMDIELPLFGVCYGHQLMAHALGGRVAYLDQREIGTRRIFRTQVTAAAMPADWPAHTTHRQAVLEVPAGALTLAHSALDANHLVRYGSRAWSTQFHPEFDAATMRAYIELRATELRAEGFDVAALLADVQDTPEAATLLQDFGARAMAAVHAPVRAEVTLDRLRSLA